MVPSFFSENILCSLLAGRRDHVDAHTATAVSMLREVAVAIGDAELLV